VFSSRSLVFLGSAGFVVDAAVRGSGHRRLLYHRVSPAAMLTGSPSCGRLPSRSKSSPRRFCPRIGVLWCAISPVSVAGGVFRGHRVLYGCVKLSPLLPRSPWLCLERLRHSSRLRAQLGASWATSGGAAGVMCLSHSRMPLVDIWG
jgi:hypothetical protein